MAKPTLRKLHRTLAPIVLLPLLVTITTGVTYRLGRSWFGFSDDQIYFLMEIHEGEYLGTQLGSIYVLLNALGLLWMLITGASMFLKSLGLPGWLRRQSKPSEEQG